MDLEQGAVDAIAMDVIVAGYQIQQRNADFKILDDSLSEGRIRRRLQEGQHRVKR